MLVPWPWDYYCQHLLTVDITTSHITYLLLLYIKHLFGNPLILFLVERKDSDANMLLQVSHKKA